METVREAKVILIFHIVGTLMELFKTDVGSWTYPESNFFRIGHVPLFSGFMYSSVGSYLARVTRIFDIRYTRYPNTYATVALAILIYANFFTHHFIADLRLLPSVSKVPAHAVAVGVRAGRAVYLGGGKCRNVCDCLGLSPPAEWL